MLSKGGRPAILEDVPCSDLEKVSRTESRETVALVSEMEHWI
jgi:hypothetical protein